MHRPIKKEDKSYTCKVDNHKLCGDPKPETPESKVYCIPDWLKCPVTDVTFDSNGDVVNKREADLGTPIINLQLS